MKISGRTIGNKARPQILTYATAELNSVFLTVEIHYKVF